MCGICGIYNFTGVNTSPDDAILTQMRDAMLHRGPDDCGLYLNPARQLGFGFRRLSIIDLSPAGHQPMCNETGDIWIVFNGEIYNHGDHRPGLVQKGHVYRGRSDTETILHLYEEYGVDCVLHLRGMFALAIWDERKQQLFLARDRIGIKPLYYAQRDGLFLFGSEVKALLAYPGFQAELNDEALFHFITFMIPPAPLTLFKGVQKLLPGHRMVVNRSGVGQPETYWEAVSTTLPPVLSENEYIDRVRALLEEFIRLRMMSDVPFGAFLSGGIDSSAVVALMSRHSNLPINTFTVGYKDAPGMNESVYARHVAQEFGANYHEVMIDGQDMLNYIPQLVHTQDEPIGDPVCVPLYYVSKLARDSGVTVIQVGEGADELFCGYPWFISYIREFEWSRKTEGIPRPFMHGAYAAARLGWQLTGRGRKWVDRFDRSRLGERPFWGGAVVYRGMDKERLLQVPYWQEATWNSTEMPEKHYQHLLARQPGADFLEQMTYLDLRHRLPELLLMRVDKIGMSTSLEARVPFLDHHLVEFVLPIAMQTKIRGYQPKYLLKKALRGIIPDNIIDRPKQGFPAPVSAWFRTISSETVRHALLEGRLAKRQVFNCTFIQQMLTEQFSQKRDWSVNLWVLFNLSAWYEHWFERRDIF